ncbi:hypothetical protein GCM10023186_18830 [Hymenobacter koreensis]|uniref:MobA-like NTP transferase domain-containing protein n=2 Tax=Hymenobacter koreensis TaxID=1084523 RepID=A0ABP8IYK5_9BACT
MGRDKGLLKYHQQPHRRHLQRLLQPFCPGGVWLSGRAEQDPHNPDEPFLVDQWSGAGPISGLLAAFSHEPNAAWLAVACDFPFLSADTLGYLVEHRQPKVCVTCFLDQAANGPEALLSIWEPSSHEMLLKALARGQTSLRRILQDYAPSKIHLLRAPNPNELLNVNTPAEYEAARRALRPGHVLTRNSGETPAGR